MQRLLTATLLLLLFALPGCSIGAPEVQPPAVRLADISFGEMGVFEQRLRLRLRVINPNGFALPLDGLRLALAVNDHPFAEGITNERVSIPSLGEETVELVATTTVFDVVQQFTQLADYEGISFRLTGTAYVAITDGLRVPFTQSGTFRLGAGRGLYEAAEL